MEQTWVQSQSFRMEGADQMEQYGSVLELRNRGYQLKRTNTARSQCSVLELQNG